jgi:hypothetical protein
MEAAKAKNWAVEPQKKKNNFLSVQLLRNFISDGRVHANDPNVA